MSDFRAVAAEGLNLDALIERMAERVAARFQNGDQGASVNGEVPRRLLTVGRAAVCIGRTKDAVANLPTELGLHLALIACVTP
jgi:hypothetical protein